MALIVVAAVSLYLFFLLLALFSYFYRWRFLRKARGQGSGRRVSVAHLFRASCALCREAFYTLTLALLYPFGFFPDCSPAPAAEEQPTIVMVHGYLHNRSGFFFCAGACEGWG